MGCINSKGQKKRKGGKVQKAAAAFEKGTAGEATERAKQAAAERKAREKQIEGLKTKSMKAKRKKAAEEINECFKDKPPTGGAAVPPGFRQ